jgi:hypothetical protein
MSDSLITLALYRWGPIIAICVLIADSLKQSTALPASAGYSISSTERPVVPNLDPDATGLPRVFLADMPALRDANLR